MSSDRPFLVIATGNPGKAREFQRLLRSWPATVRTVADFPAVEAPAETGATLRENARIKAVEYARRLGVVVLADDTGLEVDALGGAPGARSARFAGPHAAAAENRALLLSQLDGFEEPWTARFVCRLCLADATGAILAEAEGECRGRIVGAERGAGGFGYDSIFVPEGETRTLAELGADETDAIGHRGRAVRALADVVAPRLRL